MTDKTSLSYKDAGVDIDAGNALVERIKGVVKETRRPEVMGSRWFWCTLFSATKISRAGISLGY